MRRTLTGCAVSFSRRRKRTGRLFRNRFKSILVEEEPYFLQLIRCIHLNPLRSSLVASLDEPDAYPWSGHSVLLGRRECARQECPGRNGMNGTTSHLPHLPPQLLTKGAGGGSFQKKERPKPEGAAGVPDPVPQLLPETLDFARPSERQVLQLAMFAETGGSSVNKIQGPLGVPDSSLRAPARLGSPAGQKRSPKS